MSRTAGGTRTDQAPEDDEAAASGGAGEQRSPAGPAGSSEGTSVRHVLGLVATPVALLGVLLVLYLYISSRDLDSIEARQLNRETLTRQVWEHVQLSVAAAAVIVALAVPLGIVLTRPWARRATGLFVALANVGQAAPAVGVVILLAVLWQVGFTAALIAIIIYGFLPVLRNTLIGLQGVDDKLIEAARGMGMSKRAVLLQVELPLAVPVILAGIRTALILAVGVATLATFINGGGLGEAVNAGIKLRRDDVVITGGVLTAVLALSIDWVGARVEAVLRPKGL